MNALSNAQARPWLRAWFVAFAALLMAVGHSSVFAQGSSLTCAPAGYTIVFINGIRNTPEEAQVNLRATKDLMENATTFQSQPLDYRLTYNTTRGIYGDLVDSALLKAAESGVPFSAVVSAYLFSTVVDPIIESLDEVVRTGIYASAQQYYAEKIRQAALRDIASDADLPGIVAAVSAIPTNQALLIVGHSQGTLYANAVYDKLISQPGRQSGSIAVTGAAVVPQSISGNYKSYVSSKTDVILKLVGLARPIAPPINDGPVAGVGYPPEDEWLLHNFAGIYANPAYGLAAPLKATIQNGLRSITIPQAPNQTTANCKLTLNVSGSIEGWTIAPVVQMTDLFVTSRSSFPLTGTTGNTCGGERGSPLYSQDISIPPNVDFYEARTVLNVPFQNNPGGPNARPCSSFVARTLVPPPSGVEAPRERIWANATGRVRTFGGTTLDWEYQLRFDSGDPWNPGNTRCSIGVVPGSGFFQQAGTATCTAQFVALPPP